MNASYKIHADLGYVAITLEGGVALAALGGHIQLVWSDPAWKPTYNGIIDLSKASLDFTEQEVQELTKAMEKDPRCSLGKWAFVVSTAAAFAKLRKVDQVANPKATLRIFFDIRTAENWLLSREQPEAR